MLDALQYYRLGSAVDPADCAPVAMSHPDQVFVGAQPPSRRMCREPVGRESLNPFEQRSPVARRQCREILGGARRNNQPHVDIIDCGGRAVDGNCRS
jgi:hypothetical protein